jgi:hypothetical protein
LPYCGSPQGSQHFAACISNYSSCYFKRHIKKEGDNYSRNICRYRRLQEDHVIFPLPKVGDMM